MAGSEQDNYAPRQRLARANIERIAEMNDELRRTGSGGIILVTPGIKAIKGYDGDALLDALIAYDDFGRDNDPYGERDFGTLTHCGEKLFWKIDYYDRTLTDASPDPANAAVTERVMTLMLASEY